MGEFDDSAREGEFFGRRDAVLLLFAIICCSSRTEGDDLFSRFDSICVYYYYYVRNLL